MDSIGQRLKGERKRLGYNQTDFAEVGGVQKNAQSNYESDVRRPDADYLAAVAGVGLDVLYVLTGERSQASLSVEEAAVLGGFRSLDSRGRAGVLAMISGMQDQPPANVRVKGDVGQYVQGDVTTPFAIDMRKTKK